MARELSDEEFIFGKNSNKRNSPDYSGLKAIGKGLDDIAYSIRDKLKGKSIDQQIKEVKEKILNEKKKDQLAMLKIELEKIKEKNKTPFHKSTSIFKRKEKIIEIE